jgi:YggT family protein
VSPLAIILEIYSLVVLVSVIGSWVQSRNQLFELADQLTEPVLAPIRKVLPPAGGFDLSPMILLMILWFLRALVR